MASHKSALKEMRKSRARRERNRSDRAELRTMLKTARAATVSGTPEQAVAQARTAASMLDRKAAKGIIHRNAAARVKSRLARQAARAAGTQAAAAAGAAKTTRAPRKAAGAKRAAGGTKSQPKA